MLLSLFSKSISETVLKVFSNGYRSSISLDKLYPRSDLDILSKPQIESNKDSEFNGYIPIDKLKITNKTCSKPGGQNVNKTQSGVEIRFHVKTSDWIPERIREKLYEQNINRINKDGFLIVTSEKTRKNLLNQADCIEKIRTMLFEAAKIPKGISKDDLVQIEIRKKVADGRRLLDKRRRSEKRSIRKTPVYDSPHDYY